FGLWIRCDRRIAGSLRCFRDDSRRSLLEWIDQWVAAEHDAGLERRDLELALRAVGPRPLGGRAEREVEIRALLRRRLQRWWCRGAHHDPDAEAPRFVDELRDGIDALFRRDGQFERPGRIDVPALSLDQPARRVQLVD